MCIKNKRSNGEQIRMINFTYDGRTHQLSAVDTAIFFGVRYDTVYGGVARKGWTDQRAADFAAERGGHQPRKRALVNHMLYSRKLVP